jgi:hypothetical protein
MSVAEVRTAVEERFELLMQAAAYRLSVINPEMWEHETDSVPWTSLDSLCVLPDDTQAVGWLLNETRPQNILCIVMGHRKLMSHLEGSDSIKAELYADEVLKSKSLGKIYRIFALYWLDLPLDYNHDTELPIVGAITREDLSGLSGVL